MYQCAKAHGAFESYYLWYVSELDCAKQWR